METNPIQYDGMEQLLNDLYTGHGYDFTEYSTASLHRRILRLVPLDKFTGFDYFREKVLEDPHYFKRFVEEITVNVTEMLRDPSFYRTLRTTILPILATYPFIRVWHAGW